MEDSFEIFDPNSPSLSCSQRLSLLCKGLFSSCFHFALMSSFSHNKPEQFGGLFFFFVLFLFLSSLPPPFQHWNQNNLRWKTCDLPSLYLQCHKPQGKDLSKFSSWNGNSREKSVLIFAAVIFNTSQKRRKGRR